MDDYGEVVSTFAAPRHVRSLSYAPYNKADVTSKWLHFAEPQADVVVLMDPDNWPLRDLLPLVEQVRDGHAMGSPAWYQNNPFIGMLWAEVCEANCDTEPDHAAVPYITTLKDFRTVVPLWKHYLNKLMDAPDEVKEQRKKRYRGIDLGWCVEMIAWNYACAHAGVESKLERALQIRDVDPEGHLPNDRFYAIHVGRIWFPASYEPGVKLRSGSDWKDWTRNGNQVWVKTQTQTVPWTGDYPDGMSFVSRKTLEYLHFSQEAFGAPMVGAFRMKSMFARVD